jgi:hypothetical protein
MAEPIVASIDGEWVVAYPQNDDEAEELRTYAQQARRLLGVIDATLRIYDGPEVLRLGERRR